MPEARTGAALIAATLAANHVARVFAGPDGGPIVAAIAAAGIAVTAFRTDWAAVMAADAAGKLTGHPGVVVVASEDAAAGVEVALHDSTAVIVLSDRDQRASAKWAATIADAGSIPERLSRAFYTATSGRPGPVVLTIPEPVLAATTEAAPPHPWSQVHTHPGLTLMAQLQKMLWAAERPMVILGGPRWNEAAVAGMRRFAERFELPVACSHRRQALFDHDHPSFAGDLGIDPSPELAQRVKDADVLLLVGGRMGRVPSSGFSLIDIPEPRQALVHVHPGAEELGRRYRPTLAINASPAAFVSALESLQPPHRAIAWSDRTKAARASYEAWSSAEKRPSPLAQSIVWLRARLPDDAIVTTGSGEAGVWLDRFFRFRRYHTQLAPVFGAPGYALPAAIAAKLAHPERVVVCFTSAADFEASVDEFETAMRAGVGLIAVVVGGTALGGERVSTVEDFAEAFEAAAASDKPSIIALA